MLAKNFEFFRSISTFTAHNTQYMRMARFPIDKTSLLNLQKLYDAFIYDRRTGYYLKSLSREFLTLQRSHYKGEVFRLYEDLFHALTPEELQTIVRKTNKLMSKLMTKFGNFTLDPGFNKVDPLEGLTFFYESYKEFYSKVSP